MISLRSILSLSGMSGHRRFSAKVFGIIPARFNATRFPGKPLVPIDGIPMVAKVFYRAREAAFLDSLVVATDSRKVVNRMVELDIPVVMTAHSHRSGTERVAEVAEKSEGDIFVNIQGDEPFIDPSVIDAAVQAFAEDKTLRMGTVASTILTEADWGNLDVVKVRISNDGFAEDFYRCLPGDGSRENTFKHVGLYVYRKDFLKQFARMEPSPRERELDLEQMRALDNGVPIRVVLTDYSGIEINTPEDLKLAEEYLA